MQQVIPKLPKYAILGEIGHEGIGVVRKARRTGRVEILAINTILPSYSSDREFIKRFNLKERQAASIKHRICRTALPMRAI
jgi:hypothetical protein